MLYCEKCGRPYFPDEFFCESCRNIHLLGEKFPEDADLDNFPEYLAVEDKLAKVQKELEIKQIQNSNLEYSEDIEKIDHEYLFIVREDNSIVCKRFKNSVDAIPTKVVIPDNVEIIDFGAFTGLRITELVLGKNVEQILDESFAGHLLSTLTIPDKVYFIGKHAFTAAFEVTLKRLIILAKDIHIDEFAFTGNGLRELKIPKGDVTFGMAAFVGNKLTIVSIPNNVKELPEALFAMNKIHTIILGKGVKNVAYGAFLENPVEKVYCSEHL